MPVCKNVTKQQCDTNWVVDEKGEKVWTGNDNCEDFIWEDCALEETVFTQEVSVWDCAPDTETITFQTVYPYTMTVTPWSRVCVPRAEPVCTQTTEERCDTVEWEECSDQIVENCFSLSFSTPFQEFYHLLRCSVPH